MMIPALENVILLDAEVQASDDSDLGVCVGFSARSLTKLQSTPAPCAFRIVWDREPSY